MAKKKKKNIPAEAPTGVQLPATDLSPEAHNANLKNLNSLLVKDTLERREQINQLRSELSSMAADHDILDSIKSEVFGLVLSSSLSDAAERSTAEMAAATETARMMLKKAESASADLNVAEMRLLDVVREKDGVERDLERMVNERDLSRSDLDEKRKELADLKEGFGSLEQALAQMLKEREVADAMCGKLEEEGRREERLLSVMFEKDLLERGLEDGGRSVEKLLSEMEAMKRQKDAEMEILKEENKENGLKIKALEEKCRLLKEIRSRLENEVGDLKVSLDELKKERDVRVEEILKRDSIEEEMASQINQLKENMKKMAAEKDLVVHRSAEFEIKISNLQAEISELHSARKSLEDAHRSCSGKIASMEAHCADVQRDRNLKAEEAVGLRLQFKESMKAKHIVGIKLEELQKKLNHLTTENEETKKHIDYLMVEKASLEKHLETSNQGLHDIENKLKTSEDASGQVFDLLKKTTTEVVGEERAQKNCISREIGVKVEKDKEMKLFVDNLEAIKLAVKSKETKIKDLNQELELLQLSVADAKSKGGIWKWLFPATTTIFAAVSIAYAAKTRPLSSAFCKA